MRHDAQQGPIGALLGIAAAVTVTLSACGGSTEPKQIPSGEASSAAPEQTPITYGESVGCPLTLAEVQAIDPTPVTGVEIGVPLKTYIQNCGFPHAETDWQGRHSGVGVQVFLNVPGETNVCDQVRSSSTAGSVTELTGIGDKALVTGTAKDYNVCAEQGPVSIRVSGGTYAKSLTIEQLSTLARLALARLLAGASASAGAGPS